MCLKAKQNNNTQQTKENNMFAMQHADVKSEFLDKWPGGNNLSTKC